MAEIQDDDDDDDNDDDDTDTGAIQDAVTAQGAIDKCRTLYRRKTVNRETNALDLLVVVPKRGVITILIGIILYAASSSMAARRNSPTIDIIYVMRKCVVGMRRRHRIRAKADAWRTYRRIALVVRVRHWASSCELVPLASVHHLFLLLLLVGERTMKHLGALLVGLFGSVLWWDAAHGLGLSVGLDPRHAPGSPHYFHCHCRRHYGRHGALFRPRSFELKTSTSVPPEESEDIGTSSTVGDNENDLPNKPPVSKILSSALLIAGITVGGGFLALPTVVAPTGFLPSLTALMGVWAFLGAQAWVVVEAICRVADSNSNNHSNNHNTNNHNNNGSMNGNNEFPGMPAVAKAAFGTLGERVVTVLLVLVVEATLVSQISRAGAMVSSSSAAGYRIGCAIASLSVAGIVFGPSLASRREQVTTSLNSVLTVVFCAMAVLLFVMGVPAANWSQLVQPQDWKALPQNIPTFLQLLVYGEILPTICNYLNYQLRPIGWAIGIGSMLPLVLEVGWAALGMGLRPATAMSGTTWEDPVALLLAAGPIQVPLFCLALSAILTTILGSYLALQSTLEDIVGNGTKVQTSTDSESAKYLSVGHPNTKRRRRVWSAALIVLPALGIASISPSLFLKAIDFAGSYPVLLLWGIAPPAISLKLRKVAQRQGIEKTRGEHHLPTWWIKTLMVLAVGLLGMSAIPDLQSLGRLLIGVFAGIRP